MREYKVYRYSELVGKTWAVSAKKAISNIIFRKYKCTVTSDGFRAIAI